MFLIPVFHYFGSYVGKPGRIAAIIHKAGYIVSDKLLYTANIGCHHRSLTSQSFKNDHWNAFEVRRDHQN